MYLHSTESVGANIPLQKSMTQIVWLEPEDCSFGVKCFKEKDRYPDVASAIKDKGVGPLCHEKVRPVIKSLPIHVLKPSERAFTPGARCRYLKIENTGPHNAVAGIV